MSRPGVVCLALTGAPVDDEGRSGTPRESLWLRLRHDRYHGTLFAVAVMLDLEAMKIDGNDTRAAHNERRSLLVVLILAKSDARRTSLSISNANQ